MAKEIVWTESAIRDRLQIFSFWATHNDSPAYSLKLDTLFNASTELLAKYPRTGTITDYPGVWVKVIGPYRLFYRNSLDRLEVIRVWDTRRNPDALKLG